jgi:hypothetical protein
MFCDCGGRKSFVTTTTNMENGIRRHRKCASCKKNFFTVESRELASVAPEPPPPQPDKRGLYTPEGAVSLKMNKTLIRRRNEDRVSSYYIEDDYE